MTNTNSPEKNLERILGSIKVVDKPSDVDNPYDQILSLKDKLLEKVKGRVGLIGLYEGKLITHPNNIEVNEKLAKLYVDENRVSKAKKCADVIRKHDVDNPIAELVFGLDYLERKEPSKAIISLEKVLNGRVNHPKVHIGLGDSFLRLDKKEEALKHYKKHLEIKPNDSDVNSKVGFMLSDMDRELESITFLEKAVKYDKDNLELLDKLAILQYMNDKHNAALATYERIIDLRPDDMGYHYNFEKSLRSAIMRGLMNKDDASETLNPLKHSLAFYSKVAKENSSNPDIQERMGRMYHEFAHHYSLNGKHDQSIPYFKKALKFNKEDFSLILLEDAFIKTKRISEGVSYIKNYRDENLGSEVVYSSYGNLLKRDGKYDDAISAYEKAERLSDKGTSYREEIAEIRRNRSD